MEENAVSEKAGGKEVVTDMGLWREKNEATWISEQQLVCLSCAGIQRVLTLGP